MKLAVLAFGILLPYVSCLLPPKFHWKYIDFSWDNDSRAAAIQAGDYRPENIMPSGLARWKDKLFITIPRWKTGVPSSLNYVMLNGGQSQPLTPYPNWGDAFIKQGACCISSNATTVSAFRIHVDQFDRLWVPDNGVADMAGEVKQISEPAIVIYDLTQDSLLHRYILPDHVLKDTSVLTSIVVDIVPDKKGKVYRDSAAYAYITDMGANAIIVYSLAANEAWRVEHPFFKFDPVAGIYKVGGIDFYWNDGVSSAALSNAYKNGSRNLYFHPTSSTKQFKISTHLLRNKNTPSDVLFSEVKIVGDRGPNTQATACDFDQKSKILFFTQLSKNGLGCWYVEKPFNKDTALCIMSDCNLLEFPNDVKVDFEGNVWILSDRQARFLYHTMDYDQINFRVLTAPVATITANTPCDYRVKYKPKK